MERPKDQETIAPEKIISCTHRSQEERGAPGSIKSRGRGNMGKSLYSSFSGRKKTRLKTD